MCLNHCSQGVTHPDAPVDCPCLSLPQLTFPCLLLDRNREAWSEEPLWSVWKSMLLPPCTHMLGILVLTLGSVSSSLGFRLPNLSVESSIDADSHSEVHDSLINSTLSSFNFHLNLSSISFCASLFIIVLLIIISTRLSRTIADISVQVLKQKRSLDSLMRWKVELTNK